MQTQNVFLIALIALVFTACAPKAPEYTEVEDSLAPYFTAFKAEAEGRGISLNLSRFKIAFDSSLLGSNHAGKCTISEVQTGNLISPGSTTELVVSINQEIFEQSSEYGKIEVVFHELGHCLLGYSHNDNQTAIMTTNGIRTLPSSIMSTYHFAEKLTPADQDLLLGYYINQIFNPSIETTDLSQISTLKSYKLLLSKATLIKQ